MTTNEFRLFLKANSVEINVLENDAIVFINFHDLREFTKLLGYSMLDEGGIEVHLQETCVAFEIKELCDDMGIDYLEVIPSESPV